MGPNDRTGEALNRQARLEWPFDGRVARVVLAAPKANIVDRVMIEELDAIFVEVAKHEPCAVVLASDGPHFSFGASIEEHLPDQIAGALDRLSALLRRMTFLPAPTIAAVRGQCLGGGFELVLGCDLIIAEEGAQIGVPEIKLGVFPPAASALLPVRIGAAQAAALTLTGISWSGVEAKQHGLVARTAKDGALDQELQSWLESDFVKRSPAGLHHAAWAIRRPVVRALEDELPQIDRLYIDRLMRAPKAVEGIRAFLEKREAKW